MAKQSNVERLEQELTAAREAEAQAQEQADAARKAYTAAVDGGDMDAAAERQAEVERAQAQAQIHADRVQTLEAKRTEAEQADAMPGYRQAVKEAEAAIAAEAEAHSKVADLIRQLAEARRELDEVHSNAGSTIMRAHKAADAAGKPRPEFADRSRLERAADIDLVFKTARELGNVASDQASKLHTARERAKGRKAA